MSDLAFVGLAVLALLLIGSPSAVILWVIGRRAPAQDPALPCQAGTPAYRGDRLAIEPPRDAAQIGMHYDAPGWSTRIIQGVPVAVSPSGSTTLVWGEASQRWRIIGPDDPRWHEVRSRLQLEDTRADDSLPVAEPVCVAHGPNGATSVAEARKDLGLAPGAKVVENPDGTRDIFLLSRGWEASSWKMRDGAEITDAVAKAEFDNLVATFNSFVSQQHPAAARNAELGRQLEAGTFA